MQGDFFETGDALIRYYFNVEPDVLSDDKWTLLYGHAMFLNELTYKNMSVSVQAAILEAVDKIFGGDK